MSHPLSRDSTLSTVSTASSSASQSSGFLRPASTASSATSCFDHNAVSPSSSARSSLVTNPDQTSPVHPLLVSANTTAAVAASPASISAASVSTPSPAQQTKPKQRKHSLTGYHHHASSTSSVSSFSSSVSASSFMKKITSDKQQPPQQQQPTSPASTRSNMSFQSNRLLKTMSNLVKKSSKDGSGSTSSFYSFFNTNSSSSSIHSSPGVASDYSSNSRSLRSLTSHSSSHHIDYDDDADDDNLTSLSVQPGALAKKPASASRLNFQRTGSTISIVSSSSSSFFSVPPSPASPVSGLFLRPTPSPFSKPNESSSSVFSTQLGDDPILPLSLPPIQQITLHDQHPQPPVPLLMQPPQALAMAPQTMSTIEEGSTTSLVSIVSDSSNAPVEAANTTSSLHPQPREQKSMPRLAGSSSSSTSPASPATNSSGFVSAKNSLKKRNSAATFTLDLEAATSTTTTPAVGVGLFAAAGSSYRLSKNSSQFSLTTPKIPISSTFDPSTSVPISALFTPATAAPTTTSPVIVQQGSPESSNGSSSGRVTITEPEDAATTKPQPRRPRMSDLITRMSILGSSSRRSLRYKPSDPTLSSSFADPAVNTPKPKSMRGSSQLKPHASSPNLSASYSAQEEEEEAAITQKPKQAPAPAATSEDVSSSAVDGLGLEILKQSAAPSTAALPPPPPTPTSTSTSLQNPSSISSASSLETPPTSGVDTPTRLTRSSVLLTSVDDSLAAASLAPYGPTFGDTQKRFSAAKSEEDKAPTQGLDSTCEEQQPESKAALLPAAGSTSASASQPSCPASQTQIPQASSQEHQQQQQQQQATENQNSARPSSIPSSPSPSSPAKFASLTQRLQASASKTPSALPKLRAHRTVSSPLLLPSAIPVLSSSAALPAHHTASGIKPPTSATLARHAPPLSTTNISSPNRRSVSEQAKPLRAATASPGASSKKMMARASSTTSSWSTTDTSAAPPESRRNSTSMIRPKTAPPPMTQHRATRRMDELQAKIHELENVLERKEKRERAATKTITPPASSSSTRTLEQTIQKERKEKAQLMDRIRVYEAAAATNTASSAQSLSIPKRRVVSKPRVGSTGSESSAVSSDEGSSSSARRDSYLSPPVKETNMDASVDDDLARYTGSTTTTTGSSGDSSISSDVSSLPLPAFTTTRNTGVKPSAQTLGSDKSPASTETSRFASGDSYSQMSEDGWKHLYSEASLRIEQMDARIRMLEREVQIRDKRLLVKNTSNNSTTSTTTTDVFKNQTQLAAFQNAVTELKLSKEALRNENGSLLKELGKLRDSISTMATRSQKLERRLSGKQTKMDTLTGTLAQAQESLRTASSEVDKKSRLLAAKAREADEATAAARKAEAYAVEMAAQVYRAKQQAARLAEELAGLGKENEVLNSRLQHERWQHERQVRGLEREVRRKKRHVATLETSLQDLEVSLEYKAMENDELSRSIRRVMEHAKESIESATRASLVRPQSVPVASSSAETPSGYQRSHHRHMQSMGSDSTIINMRLSDSYDSGLSQKLPPQPYRSNDHHYRKNSSFFLEAIPSSAAGTPTNGSSISLSPAPSVTASSTAESYMTATAGNVI